MDGKIYIKKKKTFLNEIRKKNKTKNNSILLGR